MEVHFINGKMVFLPNSQYYHKRMQTSYSSDESVKMNVLEFIWTIRNDKYFVCFVYIYIRIKIIFEIVYNSDGIEGYL